MESTFLARQLFYSFFHCYLMQKTMHYHTDSLMMNSVDFYHNNKTQQGDDKLQQEQNHQSQVHANICTVYLPSSLQLCREGTHNAAYIYMRHM